MSKLQFKTSQLRFRLRSWLFSFYGSNSGSLWSKIFWFRFRSELKFAINYTINHCKSRTATFYNNKSVSTRFFNSTNQSIFGQIIEVFPIKNWSVIWRSFGFCRGAKAKIHLL